MVRRASLRCHIRSTMTPSTISGTLLLRIRSRSIAQNPNSLDVPFTPGDALEPSSERRMDHVPSAGEIVTMTGIIRGMLAMLMLMLATACAGGTPPQPAQTASTPTATPAGDVGDYQLGSGDRLKITVFGEDRLTGEFAVSGVGDVSFPLIGNVPAAGTTVRQLQDAIRNRLAAGYVRDPRVSVEVLSFRPYYILGEVAKPGQYPFVIGLTVRQAVATAGGYTYRANTKRVFVKRLLDTVEQQVNLSDTNPIAVQPGDTIRVSERFF